MLVDVSDYDSDRKDPDDPSARWPDDISSLEYSSGESPFPEDTSDRAQAHRHRKEDRHARNAAKYEAARQLDARKRKKSKARSEQRALRKKRDQRLDPEKQSRAKAQKRKRKAEAFQRSGLLAGRGPNLQSPGPREGELDPKVQATRLQELSQKRRSSKPWADMSSEDEEEGVTRPTKFQAAKGKPDEQAAA